MQMKSFFKLNSIRSKLIIISLILLIVPIAILGTVSYNKMKDTLDESSTKRLETSVELTIEMMESLHEEVDKGTLSLEEAQEKVKIAILGEKDPDGLRPINPNIDMGEYGYLFIADSQGNLQAHPTLEGENTWDRQDVNGHYYAQDYIQVGLDGGGLSYYSYPLPNNEDQIEEKVSYSKAFPEWDWVVVASTYMIDFNEPANAILNIIYIIMAITILVGIAIIWIFVQRISRPINQVTEYMGNVAQADLSQESLSIKAKDETGQLANALNHMQDRFREIIGNVLNASSTMTSRSEELTQAADEVNQGAEQITTTMQELAAGSEAQAHRASEITTMMNSFVSKIEAANASGERLQGSTEDVIMMTARGSGLMDDSTEQMKIVDEIVHDALKKVEGLDSYSREISELVAVIEDIADQTNLLSLNAAIEAARAGEHGQGFAVVAEEVRNLAEESSNSVVHITNIVERIQEESSIVANSLREGYEEVEQGTDQIATTGKTFLEISGAITEMVNSIMEISANLGDIAANSQEVNAAIEDIAATSEESAAGVEETTATTQQSSATMQEVASTSRELATLAEELNELVNQFKL